MLADRGLSPVAISGLLTASPLAKREAAEALDVPVLDKEELASARVLDLFLPGYAKSDLSRVEVDGRAAG